jgi:hypothetical protein
VQTGPMLTAIRPILPKKGPNFLQYPYFTFTQPGRLFTTLQTKSISQWTSPLLSLTWPIHAHISTEFYGLSNEDSNQQILMSMSIILLENRKITDLLILTEQFPFNRYRGLYISYVIFFLIQTEIIVYR